MSQLTVTPTASQQTATPGVSHQTARLLAAGIVAGPLFLVLWALQAFTRDGFDPGRHPISLLSLGDLGWIQIATFLVTGAMTIAGGRRRAARPRPGTPVGVGSRSARRVRRLSRRRRHLPGRPVGRLPAGHSARHG